MSDTDVGFIFIVDMYSHKQKTKDAPTCYMMRYTSDPLCTHNTDFGFQACEEGRMPMMSLSRSTTLARVGVDVDFDVDVDADVHVDVDVDIDRDRRRRRRRR